MICQNRQYGHGNTDGASNIMTDYTARIRAMTKEAMHGMFAAEKTGDRAKMDEAAKDYAALCAAVAAMERQTAKLPVKKTGIDVCPTCGRYSGDNAVTYADYCRFCGQKLREEQDE